MQTINYYETFYQTHIIRFTTYCPNRPHANRTRRHDRQLLCKSKFDDSNFITRLLFKDCYKTTILHHPSSAPAVCRRVLFYCYSRNILVSTHSNQPLFAHKSAKSREIPREFELIVGQGHSRSSKSKAHMRLPISHSLIVNLDVSRFRDICV